MILAAAALVLGLLLLLVAVPRLAGSAWALRSPVLALLLWQAVGLSAGLLAIELALTLALSAAGPTHSQAVSAIAAGLPGLPVWSGIAFAAGTFVLLHLTTVLMASAVQTLRARGRQRALVDLVATRNPLLPGARVVAHPLPVAYCLPGLRPRVVLSSGVLALLREDEVRAVLAHESAHLEQRHDLVVLPFVALRATFPFLPPVRVAQAEVALLVELLADDRAARRHDPQVLARALYKVGAGAVPDGGLGAGGGAGAVILRARRLLEPLPPLPWRGRAAVVAATVAVLALPPLGLLLPVLAAR